MRKIISILLLLSLTDTWVGYHLVFHFQLQSAKSEMRALLQRQKGHKDAIELSFTREECTQLEWENDEEFNYRGEMYDLVEKRSEGERIVLKCIADSKETALLQEYQKSSKKAPSHAIFAQLITAPFLSPKEECISGPQIFNKNEFRQYSTSLLKGVNTIVCPPPNVC